MEKILRLIIAGCVTFLILKSSTFGWHIFGASGADLRGDTGMVDRLKQHVYKLSQEIGSRDIFTGYANLDKTADYITQELTRYGYGVDYQEYIAYGKKVKNIIATRPGIGLAKEIIIVAAHYDTCSNPGADDNASGIAGLLELARFFSDKSTRRSVKFVAFVNEEPPFFQTKDMGSMIYAKNAKAQNEDIRGAVVLEMIGYYSDKFNSQRYPPILGFFYPNKGNFIAVVGNPKSRGLVRQIVSNFREKTRFPIRSLTLNITSATSFSDHWSFWQEGYPAVMITDTAFYRNKNYHASTDTYEKLDYAKMSEVIDGLGFCLLKMAD